MNWLDFTMAVVMIIAAFMGMKNGLIGATLTTIGGLVGWLIAGQVSDNVGDSFDNMISDTQYTVIVYGIIVIAGLLIGGLTSKFLRPVLSALTLGLAGLVDKLGGLALGFIVGLVISGALIVSLARFTYSFDLPEDGLQGKATEQISKQLDMDLVEIKDGVQKTLSESKVASLFIDISDAIPGNTLGFVPSDFKISLDLLRDEIDRNNNR
jgi:uncharacterized membrane protein required for colicin V production